MENLLAGFVTTTVDSENADFHNKVWYLQKSPVFANLTDDVQEGINGIFTMVRYPGKTLLFDLDDIERTIFVLKAGAVRLARLTPEGKEVTVALLEPGDVFGEEMLFGTKRRTTFAQVEDTALLCMARAEDLFSYMQQDATLAINVAQMLSGRLSDAADTIEELSYAKLPDKLMRVLKRLANAHGRPVEHGTAIDLRLTHATLASIVGASRESVSSELARLARENRISMSGRTIVLKES